MQEIVGATTFTDQIVAAVRQAIQTSDLCPGELYSVNQLAERFQVSRTPVREALLRLSEAGMVRFERNRGFRVLGTNVKDIAEVFHLRLLLEVPAAALAATTADKTHLEALRAEMADMMSAAADDDEQRYWRHDHRFHEILLEAAGNTRLVRIVASLRDVTMTLGASTVERSRSLDEVALEHQPVLVAVVERDAAAATAAMREHLTHTGLLLLRQVSGNSDAPDGGAGLLRSAQDLFR